jgi:hypothetical protein
LWVDTFTSILLTHSLYWRKERVGSKHGVAAGKKEQVASQHSLAGRKGKANSSFAKSMTEKLCFRKPSQSIIFLQTLLKLKTTKLYLNPVLNYLNRLLPRLNGQFLRLSRHDFVMTDGGQIVRRRFEFSAAAARRGMEKDER